MSSSALALPTRLHRNCEAPPSGPRPIFEKTTPRRAVSEAILRSVANARLQPTPTASPLMLPSTGLGSRCSRRMQRFARSRMSPPPSPGKDGACALRRSSLDGGFRSAPAENPRPAPVITTARTASSASISLSMHSMSRNIPQVSALRAAGRLSVRLATPPLFSKSSAASASVPVDSANLSSSPRQPVRSSTTRRPIAPAPAVRRHSSRRQAAPGHWAHFADDNAAQRSASSPRRSEFVSWPRGLP